MLNRFLTNMIIGCLIVSLGALVADARSTGTSSPSKSTPSYSAPSPSKPTTSNFTPTRPAASSPVVRPSNSTQPTGTNTLRSTNSTQQFRPTQTVQRTRIVTPTLSPAAQRARTSPTVVKIYRSAPTFSNADQFDNYIRQQQIANSLNQAQILALQSQLMSRPNQPTIYREQPVVVQEQPTDSVQIDQEENSGFGDFILGFFNFVLWFGTWALRAVILGMLALLIYCLVKELGPKIRAWVESKKKDKDKGF